MENNRNSLFYYYCSFFWFDIFFYNDSKKVQLFTKVYWRARKRKREQMNSMNDTIRYDTIHATSIAKGYSSNNSFLMIMILVMMMISVVMVHILPYDTIHATRIYGRGWQLKRREVHPCVVWFGGVASLQVWKQMFGLEVFIYPPLLAAATNTATTTDTDTATPRSTSFFIRNTACLVTPAKIQQQQQSHW